MKLDSSGLALSRTQNSDSSDRSGLAYNGSVFVAGLLLLERSADGFVHHLSSLSSQLGVSPTLIGLLTAGAEWEELVVVVASIAHGASNLAIANVVGSAISNILGAFSLGILFAPDSIRFDDSAKRFSIIQAGITTLVIGLVILIQLQQTGKGKNGGAKGLFENVVGVSLIVIFVLYFVGLSWAISRGMLNAPADSDSDSESDVNSSPGDDVTLNSDATSTRTIETESEASFVPPRRARLGGRRQPHQSSTTTARENTPLLLGSATANRLSQRLFRRRRQAAFRALRKFTVVFAILSLSGYLLSHSILELAKLLRLSDTVLGLTLLSFATTLPEKVLSIVAGRKITSAPPPSRPSLARRASVHDEAEDDVAQGASSILMAGAAGSNVFLLTLCLGVSLIFDKAAQAVPTIPSPGTFSALDRGSYSASTVKWQELVLLEVASLSLVLIAYTDGQRWMGVLLFAAYIAFLVAEFTWLKR